MNVYFINCFFGVTKQEDKDLLYKIIKDTSPKFLRWALNEILNWQNKSRPPGIFHLHGADDRLFPANKVEADWIVAGAGHLMVYTHAQEINNLLADHLTK